MAPKQRPGPKVLVWSIQDRRKYVSKKAPTARPWFLRWKVGGTTFTRSFPSKAAADGYRSDLVSAANAYERFDPSTGLPVSWGRADHTVASYAKEWFDHQSPTWAPRSRSNAADTLVKALPILVRPRVTSPPPTIRAQIRAWLADEAGPPEWLIKNSLPIDELDVATAEQAQAKMSLRDDGSPHAAQSIRRMRTLMRSMLSAAARQGLIDSQPWPAAGAVRAVTRITKAVDTASLPEPDVVAEMLNDVLTVQPASDGYRVLLACMYYAGLRPGEALALNAANVKLPQGTDDWGYIQVRQAQRSSGATRWTAEDEAIGDPKVGSSRDVPIPPVLCAILHRHLDGRRTGLVVSTRNGTPVSLTNLERAWRNARGNSSLTPYDLRHACATLWLRAGVPIGEAARRLGHSPEELLATYAGVLTGDEQLANARIDAELASRVTASS